MKKLALLILTLGLTACIPDEPPVSSIEVNSSSLEQGILEVRGSNLDIVTSANLQSANQTLVLSIVEKTATVMKLAVSEIATIELGDVVNLVLANAQGQATVPLNVTLPDGSVGLSKLDLVALDERYGSGQTPAPMNCPSGFIRIPGDSQFGTSDFCIMKYEAKTASVGVESRAAGLPLRGMVSQVSAMNLCQNLGKGYALTSNAQWMTIATNITSVASNWSGGSIGDGTLNKGHSDGSPSELLAASNDDSDACFGTEQSCDDQTWSAQRRTHLLSNGEVIWDFAGNAWEWVAWQVFEGKIGPSTSWRKLSSFGAADNTEQMLITDIKPLNTTHSFWNDSWDEAQGMGRYAPFHQLAGGAAMRGGSVFNGAYTGVFTLNLSLGQTAVDRVTGFRCVYNL